MNPRVVAIRPVAFLFPIFHHEEKSGRGGLLSFYVRSPKENKTPPLKGEPLSGQGPSFHTLHSFIIQLPWDKGH